MERKSVNIEQLLNAPVGQVWKAITDRDQLRKWFFDLDAFEPVVGFEFGFAGKGHKGEQYLHECRVTEVVPERRLQFSWQYAGHAGRSLVTFELTPEGDKTRLKLTHEGLETFDQGNPDFAATSFEGGWTALTQLLSKYLIGCKTAKVAF